MKRTFVFLVPLVLIVAFAAYYYRSYWIPLLSLQNSSGSIKIVAPQLSHKKDIVVVAAGDIACNSEKQTASECYQKETAQLTSTVNPDAVLLLGDIQYENGSIQEFVYFDKAWGKFKDKSFPVPGNHEYQTPNAEGYFQYFGARAGEKGKGYYSFNLGSWHVIALNSNCWAIKGCSLDDPQAQWLLSDLKNNSKKCTLAMWHHPFVSASTHGNSEFMDDIWDILYKNGADLVLVGHDHVYERFAPMDSNGNTDKNGIREFVVGTGGRSLYPFKTKPATLEASQNTIYGVLKLKLSENGYSWDFVGVDPTFKDSGQDLCH